MNKTKKIAIAAVAVVMAGTMALPLAACNSSKRKLKDAAQAKLEVSVDEAGKLSYSADTTLRMNIGDKPFRSISYLAAGKILSGDVTLPDGKVYKNGDMKPAWVNLQNKLNLKFADVYKLDSNKLTKNTADDLKTMDILTDSADNMTTEGTANSELLLDFNNYLDYMPNYKAYLDANPVVRLALTSDTDTGAMYYAPYFDGDNDVEKYTLIKKNWVKALLDGTPTETTTTFASQAAAKAKNELDGDTQTISGTSAAVEAFMGTKDWSVLGGDGKTTISIKYSDALTAAKSTSGLGAAVSEAAGKAYTGESGNIVDIMNFIINEKQGVVTGDKLLKVLQEYIDVAYKVGNEKAYEKRSDVFNSLNAAWDADLMTALFRCVVTNGHLLDSGSGKVGNGGTAENMLYALSAREKTTQRTMDIVALAGELYGVRGLESRFEYTYIDNKGELRDARTDESTYDALAKMSALTKEGLLYFGQASNKEVSYYSASSIEALMMHDYSQTQTSTGGFAVQEDAEGNKLIPSNKVEASYDFEPILTAVSNWDTNCDGKADTIMRFTESWRSIKNTGFCVLYDSVKNDSKKLAAVLAFVDYIFSEDGQIDFTFGPQATTQAGADGFWYNPEYNAATHKAEDGWGTFKYNGKTYASKTAYKGGYIPTVTDNMMNLFYGKTVNGFYLPASDDQKQEIGYSIAKLPGNYTDTARDIIGTTLPLGLKHQGFEYQCTAKCGLDGTAIVNQAVVNGVIKHVSTEIGSNKWYVEAPTALPLSAQQAAWVKSDCKDLKGTAFVNSSSTNRNIAIYIMFNGYNTAITVDTDTNLPKDAAGVVELAKTKYNLGTYEKYMKEAWANALDMYDIIK